jgi:hypothetical protein
MHPEMARQIHRLEHAARVQEAALYRRSLRGRHTRRPTPAKER